MRIPWWVWAIAGVVLLAGLLSPFASSLPDGLESVIHRERIPVAETQQPAPLPDYGTPGVRNERVGVFIAAGVGVVVVALITLAIGQILTRLAAGKPSPDDPERHESV
jgi:cobalt/nickel transport protein